MTSKSYFEVRPGEVKSYAETSITVRSPMPRKPKHADETRQTLRMRDLAMRPCLQVFRASLTTSDEG